MVVRLQETTAVLGVAARSVCAVIGVSFLAACHVGESLTPDGSSGSDSSASQKGLNVTWQANPAIPGSAGSGIDIQTASFQIDSLRVIGDAGDTLTTKLFFDLTWKDTAKPETINFDNAPSGLYSRVSLVADGHIVQDSYKITGHVNYGSNSDDFEIHDRNPLNVSLNISDMLQPGKSLTVKLELDLAAALQSVDYSMLQKDDGKLDLDTSDPQMPAFRTKLVQSFKVEGTSTSVAPE